MKTFLFRSPVVAVAMFLVGLPAAAYAKEKITETVSPDGLTVTWRIDQPDVNRPVSSYTKIRFEPGDEVTIEVGGCCQTGGLGKTWKRYVDPVVHSWEGDSKYHGLIRIPGVTEKFPDTKGPGGAGSKGLVRLQSMFKENDETFRGTFVVGEIKDVPEKDRYLRLGYEDSDYGDNGYWGRDDGIDDQCKGLPDAYLVITVRNPNAPKNEAKPAASEMPPAASPAHETKRHKPE